MHPLQDWKLQNLSGGDVHLVLERLLFEACEQWADLCFMLLEKLQDMREGTMHFLSTWSLPEELPVFDLLRPLLHLLPCK